MITELVARSLSFDELAQRLADESDDPVVRSFAADAVREIERQNNEDELEELIEESRGNYNWLRDGVRDAIKNSTDFESLKEALSEFV